MAVKILATVRSMAVFNVLCTVAIVFNLAAGYMSRHDRRVSLIILGLSLYILLVMLYYNIRFIMSRKATLYVKIGREQ